MGTTHRPFDRFDRAQRELNQVFWSSEIAGALVLEKIIADRPIGKRIYDLFPGLNCHAFWPPANARELRLKGRPEVKYNPGIGEFTTHLRANLAQTSRYVHRSFPQLFGGVFAPPAGTVHSRARSEKEEAGNARLIEGSLS